jgi:hypothetical protein
MTPAEKIEKYLLKRGVQIQPKIKTVQNQKDISTSAKQKDLLLTIAADLGYIQL